MDFDSFIDQAWADHADHSAAVAARLLPQGLPLVQSTAHIGALAHLAQHLRGAHLADWQGGLDDLQRIGAHPAGQSDATTAATLQRYRASLEHAAGGPDTEVHMNALPVTERVRVQALSAALLVLHDPARASTLLQQAAAAHEAAALTDADPATRALAVAGNNIATALCETTPLDAAQRSLMIDAAQIASRYWQRAGGWLEHERAEHRLAEVWLKAGDAPQAHQHAARCLALVAQHDNPPLERFFGNVVLGRAAAALADRAAHAAALAEAQSAFDALPASDHGWCRASLDTLRAASAASAD